MNFTVKQARVLANATQKEMAEYLGISRSTYIKIENNPGKATIEQAKKIGRYSGSSAAENWRNQS